MLTRVWIALGLLAAAPAALASVPRQEESSGASSEEPSELEFLMARDARVSFSPEAAARARGPLASAGSFEARAVAALAVGCGRAGGDATALEALLVEGSLPERRAALFALGELGTEGLPALERTVARDIVGIEAALCLGFLLAERSGAPAAPERLVELAQGDDPLGRRARLVLALRAGGPVPELGETLALYYELRWRAARTYGLVDGQRGQKAFAAELFASEEFLDRVVLAAAADLTASELKAHLGEILRSGERTGAVRVAVAVMPEEVVRALEVGQWKPTLATWHALLDEIDSRRLEKGTERILERAYRTDETLEFRAGMLLVRAGGDLPWSWIADRLERGSAEERAALLGACGARGPRLRMEEFTRALVELLERSDALGVTPDVRLALTRLGHPPSRTALEELLGGPASPAREQAIASLARLLHDPNLWKLAEQVLRANDLPPVQRLALEVGLAEGGAPRDRGALRAALPLLERPSQRLACVRALARGGGVADLELLAELFPVEDDLDLNVELALALLRNRHEKTRGLLRAALWSDSWNRSVLAGGLIVRTIGLRALEDELAVAPRTASERDLRRVGFALGEWGGLGTVETLARTRTEADPALQGALLGALAARALDPSQGRARAPKVKVDFQALLKSAGGKVPGRAAGAKPAGKGGAPKAPKKPPKKAPRGRG